MEISKDVHTFVAITQRSGNRTGHLHNAWPEGAGWKGRGAFISVTMFHPIFDAVCKISKKKEVDEKKKIHNRRNII